MSEVEAPLSPITQPPGTAPSPSSPDTTNVQDNNQTEEEEHQADLEEEDKEPFRHLEIVGLSASTTGRSCTEHLKCGEHVVVGDILRLQVIVVDFGGKDNHDGADSEEAIAMVLIRGGAETCRVGFVPRALSFLPIVRRNIDKHAQVVELFKESTNSAKRRKSFHNCGVAGVVFLDEIPRIE